MLTNEKVQIVISSFLILILDNLVTYILIPLKMYIKVCGVVALNCASWIFLSEQMCEMCVKSSEYLAIK